MNEIEQALTIEQILLQQQITSKHVENRFPDGIDYLSGAMSFLRGQDDTRNYQLAYYGALQASARGSSSGKRLVERIEKFAENRNLKDKAWNKRFESAKCLSIGKSFGVKEMLLSNKFQDVILSKVPLYYAFIL